MSATHESFSNYAYNSSLDADNDRYSDEYYNTPLAKRALADDDDAHTMNKRLAGDYVMIKRNHIDMQMSPTDSELQYALTATSKSQQTSRSCKGKRYLEFMNTGKIIPTTKKPKHCSTGAYNNNGYFKSDTSPTDHMYASQARPTTLMKDEDNAAAKAMLDLADAAAAEANMKLFDASDFDLEEKIKALPALSLDKYLLRKRDTKKKKKINSKRFVVTKSPQTILEAKELKQNSMVGSQKRKARKESITRRDIVSINQHLNELNNVQSAACGVLIVNGNDSSHMPIVDSLKMEQSDTTTSDLLILATIAEEARTNTEN